MDGRGLILLVVLGCSAASADPSPHGITPPAGWRAMPAVSDAAVKAARAVLGDQAPVSAEAWGEPSQGCFFAVIEATGLKADKLDDLDRELRAAVGAGASVTDWTDTVVDVDHRDVDAALTTPTMTATVRARLSLDPKKIPHAIAAACLHNDRQPRACETACTPLLAQLAP